jgi:hypothetical protein
MLEEIEFNWAAYAQYVSGVSSDAKG